MDKSGFKTQMREKKRAEILSDQHFIRVRNQTLPTTRTNGIASQTHILLYHHSHLIQQAIV